MITIAIVKPTRINMHVAPMAMLKATLAASLKTGVGGFTGKTLNLIEVAYA